MRGVEYVENYVHVNVLFKLRGIDRPKTSKYNGWPFKFFIREAIQCQIERKDENTILDSKRNAGIIGLESQALSLME